ncbi:MAG TPA: hypothetical protein VN317_06605 [Candidatus Methanoperedens sp.]|nr:hypothetical protein [Candidatus Methanoperedens sp.]
MEEGVKHSEFSIGMTFFTAAGAWRCTDIGTRLVVALSLEPRTNVRRTRSGDGALTEQRYLSDDPADLIGPPYSVAETVFDEYDLAGCFATRGGCEAEITLGREPAPDSSNECAE